MVSKSQLAGMVAKIESAGALEGGPVRATERCGSASSYPDNSRLLGIAIGSK